MVFFFWLVCLIAIQGGTSKIIPPLRHLRTNRDMIFKVRFCVYQTCFLCKEKKNKMPSQQVNSGSSQQKWMDITDPFFDREASISFHVNVNSSLFGVQQEGFLGSVQITWALNLSTSFVCVCV